LVVVFVAALISGPYPWARALRREAVDLAGRAPTESAVGWIRQHLDLMRVLGVAVGLLLVMILSISWVGFLIIAVLVIAYEVWLYRLGRSPTSAGTPQPPDSAPAA
jgi:hypothetical protein